jgi:inositol phosphorylceramide mannosyltransferase catalytic subunit
VSSIPRLFHQIWLGDAPLPKEYIGYQKTWERRNPGWELQVWAEDDLPDDLERPEIYERLRQPAERSDMLRLELLKRHGGVYIDSDFECRRPLEPLLDGVEFFVADLKPNRVNNAIIGSTPGHRILERAIAELRPRQSWGLVDKDGTGPLFLNRLLADEPQVTVFGWELFYPRTPDEERNAVAIHHHARSWQDADGFRRYAEKVEARWAKAQDEITRLERRLRAAETRSRKLEERLRGERRSFWRQSLGAARRQK